MQVPLILLNSPRSIMSWRKQDTSVLWHMRVYTECGSHEATRSGKTRSKCNAWNCRQLKGLPKHSVWMFLKRSSGDVDYDPSCVPCRTGSPAAGLCTAVATRRKRCKIATLQLSHTVVHLPAKESATVRIHAVAQARIESDHASISHFFSSEAHDVHALLDVFLARLLFPGLRALWYFAPRLKRFRGVAGAALGIAG